MVCVFGCGGVDRAFVGEVEGTVVGDPLRVELRGGFGVDPIGDAEGKQAGLSRSAPLQEPVEVAGTGGELVEKKDHAAHSDRSYQCRSATILEHP